MKKKKTSRGYAIHSEDWTDNDFNDLIVDIIRLGRRRRRRRRRRMPQKTERRREEGYVGEYVRSKKDVEVVDGTTLRREVGDFV